MSVITVTPPVPPAATRTGTWIVKPLGPRRLTGGFVNPGQSVEDVAVILAYASSGTVVDEFPADIEFYLDGADLPTAYIDLPGSWSPYDDLVFQAAYGSIVGDLFTNSLRYQQVELGMDFTISNVDGVPHYGSIISPYAFTYAGLTRALLIGLGGATILYTGTSDCTIAPNSPVSVYRGATLSGTYFAFAWWWQVPAVDACGNKYEGPFLQTDVDPGAPWVRYDPDDGDAHPTPAILAVTPNHGLDAGGNTVTITGSGFGVGASVTFDGVDATDVLVTTDQRLTCVPPAHAAGSATVVVTNTDGVSS